MLPILPDDSESSATIKNLINVLIQAVDFLNPRQTAVVGFDQPLTHLRNEFNGINLRYMVKN